MSARSPADSSSPRWCPRSAGGPRRGAGTRQPWAAAMGRPRDRLTISLRNARRGFRVAAVRGLAWVRHRDLSAEAGRTSAPSGGRAPPRGRRIICLQYARPPVRSASRRSVAPGSEAVALILQPPTRSTPARGCAAYPRRWPSRRRALTATQRFPTSAEPHARRASQTTLRASSPPGGHLPTTTGRSDPPAGRAPGAPASDR